MSIPDLVGPAEAAEILGVTRPRVWQLDKQTARFPEPVARAAAGSVWARADVEAYLTTTSADERPASQHPPIDLIGYQEVGDLLDVRPNKITRAIERPGFPPPIARVKFGPLWRRQDVLRHLLQRT